MKDIDQVRRNAMCSLEAEVGGATVAAQKAGMSYAQWVNLRSGAPDSKTGKPRGMRKETARKIEQAFGKNDGWLDFADLVDPLYQEKPQDDGLALLTKAWALAGQRGRAEALAWAKATIAAKEDSTEAND